MSRQFDKIIETRSQNPTEDAAMKLLRLAQRDAEKKWTHPTQEWPRALHQFATCSSERIPLGLQPVP